MKLAHKHFSCLQTLLSIRVAMMVGSSIKFQTLQKFSHAAPYRTYFPLHNTIRTRLSGELWAINYCCCWDFVKFNEYIRRTVCSCRAQWLITHWRKFLRMNSVVSAAAVAAWSFFSTKHSFAFWENIKWNPNTAQHNNKKKKKQLLTTTMEIDFISSFTLVLCARVVCN